MQEIIIHKVKITKNGVSISYDDPTFSADPDGVTREGKGEARPSFYKAMNELVDDVVNICLLDADNWCDATVTGITFKHSDEGLGVVITAQNKTESLPAPIIINTPYLSGAHIKPDFKARLERHGRSTSLCHWRSRTVGSV